MDIMGDLTTASRSFLISIAASSPVYCTCAMLPRPVTNMAVAVCGGWVVDRRVVDVKCVDRLQLGRRWRCGVSAVLWIDVEGATEKLQEVCREG
jgi:hypothetical protein